MPRLLVLEDDRLLLRALQKLFAAEQYFCQTAETATEVFRILEASREESFDLLVLDVGLPDIDGFSVCRKIRSRYQLPILILTARGEVTDRVAGLEVGADDYVTKPFDPRELVARVRAHLRRSGEYVQSPREQERVALGPVLLDIRARVAYRDQRPLALTQREFDLLHLLARHRGKALNSRWIFEQLWGYDARLGTKTLTVCVRRLRQKIEVDPSSPQLLLTVRGFGYKLAA